jgi:hypothetical protein
MATKGLDPVATTPLVGGSSEKDLPDFEVRKAKVDPAP